jgi:phosphopantothenoylcysteine decarboxylase / phosphopantothenate---cysteine ligase
VLIAPAMNPHMWSHPATRRNLAQLAADGIAVVGPNAGEMAESGEAGVGRMAEPSEIADAATALLAANAPVVTGALAGKRVLVTSGPTHEPIDPVRYIGNRSSGRMGVAIAEAALARGAQVTLIHGQTSVPLPESAHLVSAATAESMRRAVLEMLPTADVLVMAAAVADFRPVRVAAEKITREAGLKLELEPTADILAEAVKIGRTLARPPLVVGFAAETGSLARATEKAARKGVDLLVANDVAEEGSGFGTDTNRVTLIMPGGPSEAWPLLSKREVAERLLNHVVELRPLASASTSGASLAPR